MKKKRYKRIVDRDMEDYGDICFEDRLIRVNPSKLDLINTIIHEDLHREFPDKHGNWINAETKRRESRLTIKQAISLLKLYDK